MVSIFILLLISWIIAIIIVFIDYGFWQAFGKIFSVSIGFAIPFAIFCLIDFLSTKIFNSFFDKLLAPLKILFVDTESNTFDFSQYTKHSDLNYQKDDLSLIYNIDFNTLQYTANSPIAQNFFTQLKITTNDCSGSIYDLLRIIEKKEKLFFENTIEKKEIIKIAWSFRSFIKIKLEEEQQKSPIFLGDIFKCNNALERYFEDLKIQQTINEIGLHNIKKNISKIVEFCKRGKWNDFAKKLKNDRERLEMLILKEIYDDCWEDLHIGIYMHKTIISNKILQTFDFEDSFKSGKCIQFFEQLHIYLKQKEKFGIII